ncbi:chromosome segregation ATPases [Candidatus Vecturithrix granuli]|uniref:Chromosome segregation ATPases n=1 Tax=Vecturithrix granuli TaxID=1499967 RepID=A0A081BV22_VECG1|nr:chromosome segregation ATPases [Candidatus Vecturithrix granuli]
MIEKLCDTQVFQGITVSLTKRKIQKCQRQLGNGHDAELHLTVADLYKHLGEDVLALESYRAAAKSVLQRQTPLTTTQSDQLIKIYKRILTLNPLDEETAHQLSQEYIQRGLNYRAVELYTTLAERFMRQGKYREATEQYQRVFAIEPGSITARITCANLYCQLGDVVQGAQEYAYIGDLYFEYQKFDGALEYYREAFKLNPQDETIEQKIQMTQQILDGVLIPQAQASLQRLNLIQHDQTHLQHSLEEKERIERELRRNIHLLKQRYAQSVASKNEQLRATQTRLEELAVYVAAFKDNLETIAIEKRQLEEQLEQEVTHKHDLEQKLKKLNALHVDEYMASSGSTAQTQRLETAVTRLQQEKARLGTQLQKKLERSAEREGQLRAHLEQQISRGTTLEHQLSDLTQEQKDVEQKLQLQLRESQRREQFLREQMQQLIEQHEYALQNVKHQKERLEQKYRSTQAKMNMVETRNMATLEQLQGELSRQWTIESNFSEQFHESLQEITLLLQNQEQEIQKLEQLHP